MTMSADSSARDGAWFGKQMEGFWSSFHDSRLDATRPTSDTALRDDPRQSINMRVVRRQGLLTPRKPEERLEFAAFLSTSPESGDVIRNSGGCRKLRWVRQGGGKRGGVRVIYYKQLQDGSIVLLLIYAKSAQENISADVLRKIAKELKS